MQDKADQVGIFIFIFLLCKLVCYVRVITVWMKCTKDCEALNNGLETQRTKESNRVMKHGPKDLRREKIILKVMLLIKCIPHK